MVHVLIHYLPIRHDKEESIKICAATVDYENALLGFTVETEDVNGETIYSSFVAEIKPQNRVFDLNLDSTEFRKLQFIHNQRSRHGRQQYFQSRLLVVAPGIIVAVYTFKVRCIPEGFLVSEQPEISKYCNNFSWYQWDPTVQWLYYAQFQRSSTVVQSSLSGQNSLVLYCHDFAQQKPELLLSVSLPLPYSAMYYLRGETYYTSPLSLSVPIQEVNLQVLYHQNGLWCACLQHANGVEDGRDMGEDEKHDIPKGGKLDYTVYIFNNGHSLHMQVPLPMPVLEPLNIQFMVLSGFVVAYIPNLMLHFLNVGPDVDPCHHLAFGPHRSPKLPVLGTLLSSAIPAVIQSHSTSALIECTTSSHLDISINTSAFLELFKETESIEMMEDLLHLTIVVLRHYGMAMSMIEHVCQSPMRLGDNRIFSEFLLAFAFANTVFESKRYISKQLPLTMSPTFRGKVFKNTDRVTFAWLRLAPIHRFTEPQLLIQSNQRLVNATPDELLNHEVGDHPLETLCFIATISQPSLARVNVLQEIESQDRHSILSSRPLPASPSLGKSRKQRKAENLTESTQSRGTLFNRFKRSNFQLRQGGTTTTDSGPNSLLNFLKPDADQSEELVEGKEVAVGVISKVISQNLSQRYRNIVLTTVKGYCTQLENHSCTLLQLIWDSLGFNNDNDPLVQSIYRPPTPLEEILFELLEAYNLAHQEIGFPTPSGFHTLFATLGFLCLTDTLFLQYLRNGVFVPTKAFVELLLQGIQKEREHIVHAVLCHANKQLSTWAFQQWKHPTIENLSGRVKGVAK